MIDVPLVVVDVLDEVDVDVLDEVDVDEVVCHGQIASGPQFSPVQPWPQFAPVHSQAQFFPVHTPVTSSDEVVRHRN